MTLIYKQDKCSLERRPVIILYYGECKLVKSYALFHKMYHHFFPNNKGSCTAAKAPIRGRGEKGAEGMEGRRGEGRRGEGKGEGERGDTGDMLDQELSIISSQ